MSRLIVFFLVLWVGSASAQFRYRGVGIFGSFTHSAHYYNNEDTDKKVQDSAVQKHPEYFYPHTHHSKEFLNWGAGIFVEFGRQRLRWQTELEYINKGANERPLVNPVTAEVSDDYLSNKLTYIQWNNYLKFYYPLGYAHWYIMPGVRLEYLFRSAVNVFPEISANFPQFWFSANLGVGYEFPIVRNISGLVEYHWNPDVLRHRHGNTTVRNRTNELRVGLVLRPKKKSIDDCNAPVYRGPAN